MAFRTRTRAVSRVPERDGYRVQSGAGPVGVVEEAWLGADGEVAAFAVRLPGGLRALLLADDVQAVLEEDRELLLAPDARLLELAAPRLESAAGDGHVAAHWETTGEEIAPAAVRRRPRRQVPRLGAVELEFRMPTRPFWQTIAILYGGIAFLAVVVIAVAFLVAYVVAGRPY